MTTLTDEVRRTLPTRTDDDTIPPHQFTEPPVQTMPVNDSPREFHDVLITRLRNRQYEDVPPTEAWQTRYVGRILNVRRSQEVENGWWLGDAHQRFYAEGTTLNPIPEDGHYYRLLAGEQQLVKYEAGTGQWRIILGTGTNPWYMANDFFTQPPTAYYEVVYSEEAATETPGHPGLAEVIESGELDDLLAPAPANNFLELARLHDKAKLIDGVVPRVTEFVDGTLYVGYNPAPPVSTIETLYFTMKFKGVDELVWMGSWTSRWGGNNEAPELGMTPPFIQSEMLWAEAYIAPAIANPYNTTTTETLDRDIEERTSGFEAFNDALNELARERGWCSEYERVMSENGMRGRTNNKVRVAVDVTVDLNVTHDEPPYRVTSPIEGEYSLDSVSNLRFDARISVTVEGVIDRDDDFNDGFDVDDSSVIVSDDSVRDAVENSFGNGGAEWEIEDWNVDGDVYLSSDQEDL